MPNGAWGYWSDLNAVLFDDSGSTTTWIQAMPLGEFQHPVYGDIKITPERIARFADNVKRKVRGQDLDIDFDHKMNGGEAAGWVKDAEARPDGLWLLIDWTKGAYQKLKDKAYRYFSPEYNDEWTDNQGVKHEDVLFGGALTNRPFLKQLLPINMSELFADKGAAPPAPPTTEPSKGGLMDPKVLRAILGLAETATDEDVTKKLAELVAGSTPPTPPAPPTPPTNDLSTASAEDLIKSLGDVTGNPAIKALTELVEAQRVQLSRLATERKEASVEARLEALDRGKTFAVPPVVKQRLREILLEAPEQLGAEVLDAYEKTLSLGIIDMSERGWQRRGGDQSPTQRYLTEIDTLMAKNPKLSYADAASQVARTSPELAREYREESYIPSEGR